MHCNYTMLIRSAVAMATVAVVAAQGTNDHIMFTNPVGPQVSFIGGKNATYSWINPCVYPFTSISATPTRTEVQLIDATNTENVFFLETVGYIDCSVVTQGSFSWTVPAAYADVSKTFSLSIVVNPTTYSGSFQILSAASLLTTTTVTTALPLPTTETITPTIPTTPPTTTTISSDISPTWSIFPPSSTPWPSESDISDSSSGSLSTGAVVGIVVGVLVVLVAVVYGIWRRRKNKRSSPEGEESGLDADVQKLDGELKGDPTILVGASVLMEEKGYLGLGSLPKNEQQQQQQQQQKSFLGDQSTAEEQQQRKQQKEEEIRQQIRLLQLQLEQSQRQQHHQPEGPSAPSMTVEPHTPTTALPPVVGNSPGSQGHFSENLQLSNHPRPNVATSIQ